MTDNRSVLHASFKGFKGSALCVCDCVSCLFFCRPAPEEAAQWRESLDRVLNNSCRCISPCLSLTLYFCAFIQHFFSPFEVTRLKNHTIHKSLSLSSMKWQKFRFSRHTVIMSCSCVNINIITATLTKRILISFVPKLCSSFILTADTQRATFGIHEHTAACKSSS